MTSPYRNLPLNPLRAFAIASRHQSFTAAAEYMGISQVAVSRHISTLENYLNVKLFERNSNSVQLTHIGRILSKDIVGAFQEIERATQQILSYEEDQTIRLRILPAIAHYWLMPRLPDFYKRFPDYSVSFDTTVEPLDFRRSYTDVAIQMGRGEWQDVRYRRLMSVMIDVVCSPGYLATKGPLRTPYDLRSSDLLHSRLRRHEWGIWANAANIEIDYQKGVEFESSILTYSAAIAGMGVAIGQLEFLVEELSRGTLIRPFMLPTSTDTSFYIIWPTLTSVNIKTRHFIDWVLEQVNHP